jgi:hypothetical protein
MALAIAVLGCGGDALEVKPGRDVVNDATVVVHGEEHVAADMTCTAGGDVHVVTDAGETRRHELGLQGLLADTRYRCDVDAGLLHDSVSFRTDPLPDRIPQDRIAVTGAPTSGFWTLLSHEIGGDGDNEAKVMIVDPEGQVRWYFFDDAHDPADLASEVTADDEVLFGGGSDTPPTIVDLDGEITWEAPNLGGDTHHHVEELPDGQILTLIETTDRKAGRSWRGFGIRVIDPSTDDITWEWDSQRAVDAGTLPEAPEHEDDPYHANWVELTTDDDGDAAFVSLRQLHHIVRIDRATGAITWTLGVGGDFALVHVDGTPDDDWDWFYGQHAPELHLPRILMYDNGWKRPGGNYSRALELTLDVPNRTATVTWEDRGGGWYEPIWGDIDELPNGNLLVTRGHCDSCGLDNQRAQLDELVRDTHAVAWELAFTESIDTTYRSARIDGCRLFPTDASCP